MHPVQLHVEYVERRSRLTTFFRLILAIPHLIFAAVFGLVAFVVSFIAWFAILITGSFPAGMWNLVSGYLRYNARVGTYMWLATDPWPPFSGDGEYPATATLERPERQSRWKTLLRLILAIPFGILYYLLNNVALPVVGLLLWLIILITGKAPEGLHNFQVMALRFNLRFFAFVLLATDAWPSFEEPLPATGPQPAV